ncbi:MAG TPA: hypothetical protein VM050_02630 [Patescibacteria group bacterium]|nr:hypothetical protein [Patescibacteria group bacterium]
MASSLRGLEQRGGLDAAAQSFRERFTFMKGKMLVLTVRQILMLVPGSLMMI